MSREGRADGSGLRFAAPGALADPAWLAERCEDTGRFWHSTERGLNATLWWYSASLVLVQPAVRMLAVTGRAISLDPAALHITLTPWGYLERVSPAADDAFIDEGAEAFGHHLDVALGPVIDALSDVGGVPRQRLQALLSDSLGNRLLAEDRTELAVPIAGASELVRPEPRFAPISGQTFLRRASCCLVFRVPGQNLCVSCPRQEPATRQARLEQYARTIIV